jgi:hypothetical protein
MCLCQGRFVGEFRYGRRDGVDDSSTVLLIQLKKKTMEKGILALDT